MSIYPIWGNFVTAVTQTFPLLLELHFVAGISIRHLYEGVRQFFYGIGREAWLLHLQVVNVVI